MASCMLGAWCRARYLEGDAARDRGRRAGGSSCYASSPLPLGYKAVASTPHCQGHHQEAKPHHELCETAASVVLHPDALLTQQSQHDLNSTCAVSGVQGPQSQKLLPSEPAEETRESCREPGATQMQGMHHAEKLLSCLTCCIQQAC